MAAAQYIFRRVRDELRAYLRDDSDQPRYSDEDIDAVVLENALYDSSDWTFDKVMTGYYRCVGLGGSRWESLWLVFAGEDSNSPAPFSGAADAVYELSCRGAIRERTGNETGDSISVNGFSVPWKKCVDQLLERAEIRKSMDNSTTTAEGSFTPTEEGRVRLQRHHLRGVI